MTTGRFLDRRYENPVTWSIILHGKNVDTFQFLYGLVHWISSKPSDIYLDAHFNLETIIPTPLHILERHAILHNRHLKVEEDEQEKLEWFRATLKRDGIPTVDQWKLQTLGYTKSYDVSSKFRWIEDNYLQLTFLGYSTVPVSVIMEWMTVGLNFDLYWFNHATMETGGYSTDGNADSKYLATAARSQEDIIGFIYPDLDIVDEVPFAKGLLWLHEIILSVDEGMKNFIANHPKETWCDDNAKIFPLPQLGFDDVASIENLLDLCQVGVPLSKKAFWKVEMATLKLFKLLNPVTNKEAGFLYYRLESTVRYVKEELEKLIADG